MKLLQIVLAIFLGFAGFAHADELVPADLKGPKIPDKLLATYKKLTAAIRDQDTKVLETCILPGAVEITTAERAPKSAEYGTDMNLPFLKKTFRPTVLATASPSPQTFSLRTATTHFRFVRTDGGDWMIYGYNDKPIE